ncbi:FAD-dependent oxidoreductase [Salinarimonas sp. NSM]|uniref:FAD-dependent oxidoreductase n=1 Tax=Salinarimonas sp. NSM TaxID=3458003 RepID=UPI004035CB74
MRAVGRTSRIGDPFVDVCIVGAGAAGLHTALSAAERGASVAVLERGAIGEAASGNNGGFLDCGYFSLDFEGLVARVGRARARRLVELSVHGWAVARRRAAAAGIVGRRGMLTVSRHAPGGLRGFARMARETFGLSVDWVAPGELGDHVRAPHYHEGLLDHRGITIAPDAMIRALAGLARAGGVRVLEHAEVRGLARDGGRWRVETSAATMIADSVVVATGDAGALAGPEAAPAFGLYSHVALSEPLDPARVAEVLPSGLAVADTRLGCDYFSITNEGRLRWGGRLAGGPQPRESVHAALARDIAATLPTLGRVRLERVSSGAMHYGRARMPRIGRSAAGLLYAGCFGHIGNATTAMAGEVIADALCGDERSLRLFAPFAGRRGGALPLPIPLPARSRLVAGALRARDALDEMRARAAARRPSPDDAPPALERPRMPALARVDVELVQRPDGYLVRSRAPLRPFEPTLVAPFRYWARVIPRATFLAERGPDGAWRELRWGEARRTVDALSARLLAQGVGPGDTVLIAAPNGIDHGCLVLAAMQIGAVVAPVSPAHVSGEDAFEPRLDAVLDLVSPRAVFTRDADALAGSDRMRAHLRDTGAVHLYARGAPGPGNLSAGRIAGAPDAAVERAVAALEAGTPARITFTSGSTGRPKGVVATHGMLSAQQQMMAQAWPFLETARPVLVDWLPWTHVSGGVNSFNMTVRNGGALHIDDGRPTADGIGRTVENLTRVSPTWYTNVPLGWRLLVPRLEEDAGLRASFLRRLDMALYGGAALDGDLWERLRRILDTRPGGAPVIGCGWGSTETTSTVTVTHHAAARNGEIGHPLPGLELKLVRTGDGFSAHVRGPSVVRSYLGDVGCPIDDEGFYAMGDAVGFVDPQDPERGLRYEGRLGESFKLSSGAWVEATLLRTHLLAALAPHASQVLVAGPGRERLVALVWPASVADLDHARRGIDAALHRFNDANPRRTRRIAAFAVSTHALSLAAGEITEKGTINQARCFETRSAELAALDARALAVSAR